MFVLRMSPRYKEKVVVNHCGEEMELIVKYEGHDTLKLVFDASRSWDINRKKEEEQ